MSTKKHSSSLSFFQFRSGAPNVCELCLSVSASIPSRREDTVASDQSGNNDDDETPTNKVTKTNRGIPFCSSRKVFLLLFFSLLPFGARTICPFLRLLPFFYFLIVLTAPSMRSEGCSRPTGYKANKQKVVFGRNGSQG